MPNTQIFEIFLSVFREWGLDSLESRQELLCKLATGGSRLARQSHQNKVTKFLKFFENLKKKKKKNFPKTIKTLKNLFVFDQHIIEHVKHI